MLYHSHHQTLRDGQRSVVATRELSKCYQHFSEILTEKVYHGAPPELLTSLQEVVASDRYDPLKEIMANSGSEEHGGMLATMLTSKDRCVLEVAITLLDRFKNQPDLLFDLLTLPNKSCAQIFYLFKAAQDDPGIRDKLADILCCAIESMSSERCNEAAEQLGKYISSNVWLLKFRDDKLNDGLSNCLLLLYEKNPIQHLCGRAGGEVMVGYDRKRSGCGA